MLLRDKFYIQSLSGARLSIFLTSLFCIITNSAFAQPLIIDRPVFSQEAGPYLELLEDPGSKYGAKEILDPEGEAIPFTENGNEYLSLNYTDHVWWVRLRLQNHLPGVFSGFLVLDTNTLDRVDVYRPDGNGGLIHEIGGDEIPYSDWSVKSMPAGFNLQVEPGESQTILFRLESSSFLSFPVLLMDLSSENSFRTRRGVIEGLYIGLIFILTVFLFYFMSHIREPIYFWYLVYGLSFSGAIFVEFGHAYPWLWPDFPVWQNRVEFIFMAIAGIAALSFVSLSMNVKTTFPLLFRIFKAVKVLFGIYALLVFLGVKPKSLLVLFTVLEVITGPAILLVCFLQWRNGYKSATYFLGAWSLTYVVLSMDLLAHTKLLPFHPVLLYSWPLAVPLELLFLILSLHHRILDGLTEIGRELSRYSIDLTEKLEAVSRSAKSRRSHILNVNVDVAVRRLQELMENDHVYRVEDLRAAYVANELHLTVHQLSELLNRTLGMSFNGLVNEYRIREAKMLLSNEPDLRILDIAFQVGFQSKTSFNNAFKASTGLSPSQYRKMDLSETGNLREDTLETSSFNFDTNPTGQP